MPEKQNQPHQPALSCVEGSREASGLDTPFAKTAQGYSTTNL
jgi:hypothetical protein